MTVHQAILYGEEILQDCGIEQQRWNAERLLLRALNMDRAQVYADLSRELSHAEWQAYRELLRRRSEHYPLAYLEASQEFFGRDFFVGDGVLIPRPETEEIVHAVLEMKLPSRPRILDLGAGTGCVAVTLALEIHNPMVVAVELSVRAFTYLKRNLRGNVFLVRANMEAPPFLAAGFDLIVSNPPYVEEALFRALPPETHWEPREALVTSNLEETYRRLLQQSERLLRSGGRLVFEIGFGQSERIRQVCAEFLQFALLHVRNDYREVPRTFVLEKV